MADTKEIGPDSEESWKQEPTSQVSVLMKSKIRPSTDYIWFLKCGILGINCIDYPELDVSWYHPHLKSLIKVLNFTQNFLHYSGPNSILRIPKVHSSPWFDKLTPGFLVVDFTMLDFCNV